MTQVESKQSSNGSSTSHRSRSGGDGISLLVVVSTAIASAAIAFLAGTRSQSYFLGDLPNTNEIVESNRVLEGTCGVGDDQSCPNWVVVEPSQEDSEEEDSEDDEDDDDDDEEGTNVKSGQFLFNIEKLDGTKIDSQEKVIQLTQEIMTNCDLSLSTYFCHGESSTQITCAGKLVNGGHVALHAMPLAGFVALDIMILGESKLLLPFIQVVEELFETNYRLKKYTSIERGGQNHPLVIHTSTAFKVRGIREHFSDLNPEFETFGVQLKQVVMVQSQFQKIEIYDRIEPDHEAFVLSGLEIDPDYVFNNPTFFAPDRDVMLDEILQSSRDGNAAYHESLVQPAMFAHKEPKRVAIIGGGECATLREALKHKTVEEVVMIEIDPTIIEIANEYLIEWNDCSNIEGSTRYCIEDKRAKIFAEDAFKWFIDRYASGTIEEELFDVVIMDALDPQNVVEFASALYGDGGFLTAIFNSLSDSGILISQVGESVSLRDPAETDTANKNRVAFVRMLESLGFQSIFTYQEAHSGFGHAWSYYVAFKDQTSETEWFDNAAAVDLKIQKRLHRTVDGTHPFTYFDGATMLSYQYPSKQDEVVYCRQQPRPARCEGHGYNPEMINIPTSDLTVQKSAVGENAGRGVYAKVDIPENSYIALETMIHQVIAPPPSNALIEDLLDVQVFEGSGLEAVTSYLWGYGYSSSETGKTEVRVDAGIPAFVNHGCNGTANVGDDPSINEETVELDKPIKFFDRSTRSAVYDPTYFRDHTREVAMVNHKAIKAGEEILENYITFGSDHDDWNEYILELRDQCRGVEGEVTRYEKGR